MNAMKLTMFSILGLGVAFVPMARADGPSTRPDVSGINRQAWRALRGTFRADAYANLIYFSQDEWNDMMGFMQTVSPARANVLARTNLPVESPIRQGLIRRWRAYKFVRDHFLEMAQLQERRFTLEDDLFVLGMKEKDRETNPSSRTSDSADDLREKIHAKVTELLDLGIQEDRLRIEKLNRMLANANNTLAQDQAREPQAVELRTENLMGRFSHPTTRPSGASPHGDAGDGGSNAVSDQTDMSNPASGDADTPATVN